MSEPGTHPLSGLARGFVRALWGLEASVLPLLTSNEFAARRSRFLGAQIWLPTSRSAEVDGGSRNYVLAAASHIAAHRAFGLGRARFAVGTLKPVQVAIVSLLEDARVERLARERYPGLVRLWDPFYDSPTTGSRTSNALLARLARALHDDGFAPDDGWVKGARQAFWAARDDWAEANFARVLGGRLGNELGQMRVPFSAREYAVQPAYRDDNLGLWQLELESSALGSELELTERRRREPSARPRAEPRPSVEATSPDASPSGRVPAMTSVKPTEAKGLSHHYPEWDYVICRERSAFTTLREKPMLVADPAPLDAALAGYATARFRLQRAALRLASERAIRVQRLRDGERLDVPAAIAAVVAQASGQSPNARVYQRVRREPEPSALLLLLDCSESLNAPARIGSGSVLEHARSASALLAQALHGAGSEFAIHGFSSNGRDDVGYFRFKDFEEPYDERARARLAGMRAGLSTRLGTALRHAGRALRARGARRKLLLVVSDGEPSDIDSYEPKYLLLDAKRATRTNRESGVTSFCLGLDPRAQKSLLRIFGPGNYVLTERLEKLPEVLGRIYLRLAR